MAPGLTISFEGPYAAFPANAQEALREYTLSGRPMGRFLTSVASNDLFEAIGNADDENGPLIKLYVQWFYNVAPSGCWGSKENVKAWLAHRGLAGLEE
jgi:hypothetical protein